MKILRVRRGFTTNSSGDNEYLSPTPPPPATTKTTRDASTNADAGAADARSADATAESGARDAQVDAEQSESADADIAVVAVRSAADAGEPATGASSHGGAFTLIWIVVGVVAMFIAERILRLVWRRSRERPRERLRDDDER